MGNKIQFTATSISAFIKKQSRHNGTTRLARAMPGISVIAIAALLAACGASTPTPPPTQASTLQPAPTDTPAVTATVTSLDPCQLIDSQEASTYTGASFGQGVEETTSGGGKICTYGANTTNVFMVEVAQAKSLDEAKAAKADFINTLESSLAQLTSEGLQVTELPNFADGATMGQMNITLPTGTLSGSAIGVLKGTIFFGFSDEVAGGQAPSAAAVQAEATSILARLP